MNVHAGEIDRMWEKLGFEINRRGADIKADLVIGGRIVVHTYRSHGASKMSGQIPNFIRQKMKLNERQFADAVKCPLTRAGYIDILRAKGQIPGESPKDSRSPERHA